MLFASSEDRVWNEANFMYRVVLEAVLAVGPSMGRRSRRATKRMAMWIPGQSGDPRQTSACLLNSV